MSPIAAYMKQVKKMRRINREEEVLLARRYRDGDKRAGQKIIEAHLLFAVREAHKWNRKWRVPLEDLVQVANEGMLRALESFDPERGFRFLSYARYWTRTWLDRYVMRNARMVNFGTTVMRRRLFFMAWAVVDQLKHKHPLLGFTDLLAKAAVELGAGIKEVEEAYHHGQDRSIDEPLTSDARPGRMVDRHYFTPDNSPRQDELLNARQESAVVATAVRRNVRSGKEWAIVEMRLLAEDPAFLSEIAERCGVSRERVRQIESGLLARAKEDILAAGYIHSK